MTVSIVKLILPLFCFLLDKSLASPTPKAKVCVIGAGAAGISVSRQLADNLEKFDIIVFERSSEVGGTWIYTDNTGLDDYGYPIHSAMYKNLRTNAAVEVMNFADWPEYEGVTRSCVPHYVVLEYLKNYTDHFQLKRFIQFDTIVENVKLYNVDGSEKWKVDVKNVKTSEGNEYVCDHVVVCNGHYFSQYIPVIPGIKDFKGRVLHSHDYRKPESFKNKTIILLGAGSSGVDIGLDLKNVAAKVYLSHNKEKINVSLDQISGIDRFENGTFILKDNSSVCADALMFCTGYNYDYPFLDNSTGITVDNNYVSPLYKHIINVQHPTMSFLNNAHGYGNFARIYSQARYIASFINGKAKLPPKEIMLEDSKLKAERKKDAHSLMDPWGYLDELAYLGGFTPLPEYYKTGQDAWTEHWLSHHDDFKDYNLIISDDKHSVKIVKI